jgi:hypothetical protein
MRNDNRIPWWLWPNVLSLDAPAIAIAWQEVFARLAGVAVAGPDRAALFLAVWIVYAVDRLADGFRLQVAPGSAHRHRFSREHARAMSMVVAVAVVAGLAVLPALSPGIVVAGAAMGAVVAVYFVWNHLAGSRFGRGWLKEVVVSLVFAAGAGLVPLVTSPSGRLVAEIGAFAIVCFSNCLLIARLERDRDLERGEASIAPRFPADARPARVLSLVFFLICAAWLVGSGRQPSVLALAGSGAAMFGATFVDRFLGTEAACVAADLALLMPAVVVICG